MGCAGSKSTPVVEANTDVNKNLMGTNGTLMQKVDDLKDDIIEGITEKASQMMDAIKPSTPETERAGDSEGGAPNTTDVTPTYNNGENEGDMVAEDAEDVATEPTDDADQAPVKLPFNPDELEEGTPAINDKPPTPMPEAVILNAQWPRVPNQESNDKSIDDATKPSTPLHPIEEEKRLINIPATDEAAVIEILTIEIAKIPIADETSLNDDNEKDEENEDDKKE